MSIRQAREVLRIEAEGILSLIDRVGQSFAEAVEMLLACQGRVVIAGIGKSGLVARKVVATLNSTGTPALFLHPVEALHGDLGMMASQDVLVAVSNSGETDELNAILPPVKRLGSRIIALTGCPHSSLGRSADLVIDVGVTREACPLGLAPTASTTAALAMGDALAVCLLTRRGFKEADFKARHPSGRLGERLAIRVSELMLTSDRMPLVGPETPMPEVIGEMDLKDLGHALVVDEAGRLLGILTDGDLRRALREGRDIGLLRARELMTAGPKTIAPGSLAADALQIMELHQITALPVLDGQGKVEGIVHLHDLLGRGSFNFRPLVREEGV